MGSFTYSIGLLWIFFTSSVQAQASTSDCHPAPTKSLENVYVVGYGSLINSISKNKTSPTTSPNIPVNIHGYARKWNCKGAPVGLSTTYLGVEPDPTTYFNGVVFKLTDIESLKEFDKREIYYCRQEIKSSDIQFLTDEGLALANTTSAQYWIYVVKPEFVAWPSAKYPIVQSYVDVFLSGCLEMEKTHGLQNYSDICMETTEGWNKPWVNDRLQPRRPWSYEPKAYSIDVLINKHLPKHFDSVLIEQEIRHNFQYPDGGGLKSSAARISTGLFFLIFLLL